MAVDENVNPSIQAWEGILARISKIREDLISDADSIELLLVELYEKKERSENLDDEKAEFAKILQEIVSFPPVESRITTLEDYRKVLEEWKSKREAVFNLLLRIKNELLKS